MAVDTIPLPVGKDKDKEITPKAVGMTAIKPEGWDRTGWEAFKYTMYDPKHGTILNRTPLSWLCIIGFYLIYYTFLTGFWIGCLCIFFCTLPAVEDGPKWQRDWSIIGENPGVGFRPRSSDYNINSNIFSLKAGDINDLPSGREGEGELNADYAKRLEVFMEVYKNTSMGTDIRGKEYEIFDVESKLGGCANPPYGYTGSHVTPCIMLKLNNIWGWVPRAINCTDPREYGCTDNLKKHLASENGIEAVGTNNVWVDCEGRNPADKEALSGDGKLEYFPATRNLPISSFPYEGRIGGVYHSPLVALKVTPGVIGQLIHIECRSYFKGVIHSTKEKIGLVQFEVIVREH